MLQCVVNVELASLASTNFFGQSALTAADMSANNLPTFAFCSHWWRMSDGALRHKKTDGGCGPRPPNRADRPRFARRPRKRKELFVIPCISNILESYARGPYGRPCGHKLWLTCASAFGSVAGGNPWTTKYSISWARMCRSLVRRWRAGCFSRLGS